MKKGEGTTHGTSYRHDSDVPVMLAGPGVKPGRYGGREMIDLAPTLSDLLGVSAPAGSEGQVIPLRTVDPGGTSSRP